MKRNTPKAYTADDCCVDCGKGVDPHQAETARRSTFKSRALGHSRNREGFVLCRRCLDRETREARTVRAKVWEHANAL
jgi:hypothetical protein